MAQVLVIPDIHLKPWMFARAAELMRSGAAGRAVCLMDIADDWDQQFNIDVYAQSYAAAVRFAQEFRETLWCYGNHDLCYPWNRRETGYSRMAAQAVCDGLEKLEAAVPDRGQLAYVHRIDNVLFSHGGLSDLFVRRYAAKADDDADSVIRMVNSLGAEAMWQDLSPIWYRPQYSIGKMYSEDRFIHVAGHTPVDRIRRDRQVISCDVFSTRRDGTPIGTQEFPVIDTLTGDFQGIKW